MGSNRRKTEPAHVRLYNSITRTEAFGHLSGWGVKALIVLARLDNGSRNGELFLSNRQAAKEMGCHRHTASRALKELEDKGFIATTVPGHFKAGEGQAACWRLTWVAWPGHCGPTHDYRAWRKKGKNRLAQKIDRAGTENRHEKERAMEAGTKNRPADRETSLVSVEPPCRKYVPQLVCHGDRAGEHETERWKHAAISGRPKSGTFDDGEVEQLREGLNAYLADAPPGAQSSIAEAAGISGGTLSKFKNGERGISRAHFDALRGELGSSTGLVSNARASERAGGRAGPDQF